MDTVCFLTSKSPPLVCLLVGLPGSKSPQIQETPGAHSLNDKTLIGIKHSTPRSGWLRCGTVVIIICWGGRGHKSLSSKNFTFTAEKSWLYSQWHKVSFGGRVISSCLSVGRIEETGKIRLGFRRQKQWKIPGQPGTTTTRWNGARKNFHHFHHFKVR